MLKIVRLSKGAKKDILRVPQHVAVHLTKWVEDVEHRGLDDVRKVPGYHDEPLQGKRKGERSIRLTRAYRAIYRIHEAEVKFIEVQEVNKHEY
jgi:proteic killer suppression protein